MSVTSQRETRGSKFSTHYLTECSSRGLPPHPGSARGGKAGEGRLPACSGDQAACWWSGLDQGRMSRWGQPNGVEREPCGAQRRGLCARPQPPVHGCQELCSLSDGAVSSAWLFPRTQSSTWSHEKQINRKRLAAREKRQRWVTKVEALDF